MALTTTLEIVLTVLTVLFAVSTTLLIIYLILNKCCKERLWRLRHTLGRRRSDGQPSDIETEYDRTTTTFAGRDASLSGYIDSGRSSRASGDNGGFQNAQQSAMNQPLKRALTWDRPNASKPQFTTRYERQTLDVYLPEFDVPNRLSILPAAQHYYENQPLTRDRAERKSIIYELEEVDEELIVPEIQQIAVGQLGATPRVLQNVPQASRAKSYFRPMDGTASASKPEVDVAHGMYVSQTIGTAGGQLDIHDIQLKIPRGALTAPEKISIGVLWTADHQNSALNKKEAVLSPVVSCEPHGLKLLKPATLKLPHCAVRAKKDWQLTVWNSETETNAKPNWVKYQGSHTILEKEQKIKLELRHFTLYNVSGEPLTSDSEKYIEVIAFAPVLGQDAKTFPVRIYCLNDYTDDAARENKKLEQIKKRGKLKEMAPPENLMLANNQKNVCLDMDFISEQWDISAVSDMKQELDFDEIWQARGASSTFVLETNSLPQSVKCTIMAYQLASTKKKKLAIVAERQKRGDVSSRLDLGRIQKVFPGDLCEKIKRLLDPDLSIKSNNWVGLAEELGYTSTDVFWLADERKNSKNGSPTLHLLNEWVKADKTRQQFIGTMKKLERHDIADDLEEWEKNNT